MTSDRDDRDSSSEATSLAYLVNSFPNRSVSCCAVRGRSCVGLVPKVESLGVQVRGVDESSHVSRPLLRCCCYYHCCCCCRRRPLPAMTCCYLAVASEDAKLSTSFSPSKDGSFRLSSHHSFFVFVGRKERPVLQPDEAMHAWPRSVGHFSPFVDRASPHTCMCLVLTFLRADRANLRSNKIRRHTASEASKGKATCTDQTLQCIAWRTHLFSLIFERLDLQIVFVSQGANESCQGRTTLTAHITTTITPPVEASSIHPVITPRLPLAARRETRISSSHRPAFTL